MERGQFDELDRQLAHALFIDGRASFSLLGKILGLSDQTIARRYTRLRGTQALRVYAHARTADTGERAWLLRIRCAPAATTPIAEALARREDTSWVSILSGSGEIVCNTQNYGDRDSAELFLSTLPRVRSIENVTAHRLLHKYTTEALSLVGKHGPLTPTQIAEIAAEAPIPTHSVSQTLTVTDHRLLTALASDGRQTYETLAAVLNSSATTIRRRVRELRESGLLRFAVEVDWRMFGLYCRAGLWMSVDPARLHAVGTELAEHPEVSGVAATTGPTNLAAGIIARDDADLYEYVSTRLAAIPGIKEIQSAPVVRMVKLDRHTL
ncbi:Lrp/AsnC family transcriptional regulator [Nocardia brasiliensis]|uniref:Lrp/AsnC family transcriptional regulator n=1 Tax=Nocardia brasiliensis TaxID=37326 RepID=UPI003D8FF96D